jgi:hypothetical protein
LIVSLGFAFQSNYPNLAHCIEAVILAHALAAQVRGSYRNALALATIAVFVKPSMGYVFGGVLLLKALEIRRERGTVSDFLAMIIPSAITFTVLSVVLIRVYGARSFSCHHRTDRRRKKLPGVALRVNPRPREVSLEPRGAAAAPLFYRRSRVLDGEHGVFW